jgi:2-methylcitrate dehydratase PrpD
MVVVAHALSSVPHDTLDGERLHEARLDAPRGTPRHPLADAEVIAKFRRLASAHLDAHASEAYAERFLRLEDVANCDWIFECLDAGSSNARRVRRRLPLR